MDEMKPSSTVRDKFSTFLPSLKSPTAADATDVPQAPVPGHVVALPQAR